MLATCLISSSASFASDPQHSKESRSSQKPHWGYAGEEGFQHWGDLSADYHTCKTGQAQSPIDIQAYEKQDLPALHPDYKSGSYEVINNGHTLQVNTPHGGTLQVADKTYELLQFHFHTPSEHYVDGAPYPMEVHFVHKTKDGTLGVVGVMLELGSKNPAIDKIWSSVGHTASLSPADLLPKQTDYYKYEGSLTTPPCSEGVQWHVLKQPIQISEDQLRAFQALFSVNARPVQPLHERVLAGD